MILSVLVGSSSFVFNPRNDDDDDDDSSDRTEDDTSSTAISGSSSECKIELFIFIAVIVIDYILYISCFFDLELCTDWLVSKRLNPEARDYDVYTDWWFLVDVVDGAAFY